MLQKSEFYAGIAVDDVNAAEQFYGSKLGLDVRTMDNPWLLEVRGPGDRMVLIYQRPNHVAPENTVLNFPVPDIEAAVDELTAAGVVFEQYPDGPTKTNDKGIAHPGPWQAWFKDPAGNILSVVQ
jgi:catechol 2,3-dioxygenase-like lactoylglutathione lyase family enzyme